MKIAMVDDERHALERFERMTGKMQEIELCGLFENGEELLSYIKINPLDAVFLDIEMPGCNGLELSEKILKVNQEIDIVFITAFNRYAVDAFEINAIDYILKPLIEERLIKTLNRLSNTRSRQINDSKPLVQCFGSFEVYVCGNAISWKNSRAKEILAYLVFKKGEPVNWEKIAAAIWPDYDTEKAHTNFHATTYLLRKRLLEAGLSQILECKRGNYKISTELIFCDAYILDEKILKNQVKRREDLISFEKMQASGYMEENGFEWAYAKSAEYDNILISLIGAFQITG